MTMRWEGLIIETGGWASLVKQELQELLIQIR